MAREQRDRLPDWEPAEPGLTPAAPRPPAATPGRGAAPAGAAEPLVRFDAERALRAITFHLLDERLALSVAPDSFGVMLSRLRRRCLSLAVARTRWAVMTNRQRLEWLLSESGCGFVVTAEQVAVLGHAATGAAPSARG